MSAFNPFKANKRVPSSDEATADKSTESKVDHFGLFRPLPSYFRGKFQLIGTVTFTAFFSLVFILLSVPFTDNAWFQLGRGRAFAATALFFFVSLAVVIISKRVMYATRHDLGMTYVGYILWNLAEVLIICLLYTAITIWGDTMGVIHIENPSPSHIFFNALLYCFTALIVPYIIAGMYMALVDKNNTIRLMDYREVVSDEPAPSPQKERKITLFDNNGVLKMSVNLENLYYIESDGNYIIVWYTDAKGELKRYLVRSKLKTVEESFRDSPMHRCHRKYIVNMDKVRLLRKEKDGYQLELDNDAIPPITVTPAYVKEIIEKFNGR